MATRIFKLLVSTSTQSAAQSTSVLTRDARIRKFIKRAEQRGMLELDLIMGKWSKEHVSLLNDKELDLFEEILTVETPDLLKMVLGQVELTPAMANNSVFSKLLKHVEERRNIKKL